MKETKKDMNQPVLTEKKERPSGSDKNKKAAPPRVWNGFSLSKKKRKLILEMGDGWLKMAGITEAGKKSILSCLAIKSTHGVTEIDTGLKIREFIQTHKFKPDRVVVLHPSYNLTSRILSLPSLDPHEIRDMVGLQAVKQTPYTKDEITTGYRIIDRDETSGYSRILLAISHRDVASGFYRTVEMASLNTHQINISLEGLRGWYDAYRVTAPEKFDQPVVLLDMDWTTTEFIIFIREKLVFSRTISFGMKHYEDQGEQGLTNFVRDVQRSIEGGQAEMKFDVVSRIILTGMSSHLEAIGPVLSKELTLPAEVVLNPEPFLKKIPAGIRNVLGTVSCSFASILGFGFMSNPAVMNLIPQQIEAKKALETRARDLAIFGSLLLALVTIGSAIGFEKIYKLDQYYKTLLKEYEMVKAPAEEVERYVAKMKLASEQTAGGAVFLDVLSNVIEVLPESVYLTAIQYQETDHALVLRGVSEEMSTVFKLLTQMEGTSYLEMVKTRNVTKRKVKDKEVVEFEISANVMFNPDKAAEDRETVPEPA